MLHQWAILSAQRLSGPVDCDKATESGSDLAQGVNRVFFGGCTFYTLASSGRKSAVIHEGHSSLSQTFAVRRAHKGLNSRVDYSWLGGLESNTVNCGEQASACTVSEKHPKNSRYCCCWCCACTSWNTLFFNLPSVFAQSLKTHHSTRHIQDVMVHFWLWLQH